MTDYTMAMYHGTVFGDLDCFWQCITGLFWGIWTVLGNASRDCFWGFGLFWAMNHGLFVCVP